MSSQDLHLKMLNDTHDKVESLREDIREVKDLLSSNVIELKTSQAKCESKWALVDKFLALILGGVSISGVFAYLSTLFGTHK